MTQSTRFAGKTVIVTGSSTGIGEGIARRFHDEGANVVINARNAEKCAAVAADLGEERALVELLARRVGRLEEQLRAGPSVEGAHDEKPPHY